MWQYNGSRRPDFAEATGPGEQSVWDFPRPPALRSESRVVRVCVGGVEIARSHRALKVVETASAPCLYVPLIDVRSAFLVASAARSYCEWKGTAAYCSVRLPDGSVIENCAWHYPTPTSAFGMLAGHFAFYPTVLECYLDDERAQPQDGGFYGGWVTKELRGPIKGAAGTGHW